MSVEDYFDALYGEAEGWVCLVNRDPEDWSKVNSEHWKRWPESKAYIVKYCKMRSNEDTYAGVGVFSDQVRTKDDPRAVTNVVHADADTCHPDNFRARPSMVLETSPGRWHCWWVLESPVPSAEAAQTAQRIAYAHRDQGCDLGWFASKILRVPGTTNLKDRNNPYKIGDAEFTGELYTLEALNELYADQTPSAPVALSDEMPEFLSYTELAKLEQRVIVGSPYENLYTQTPESDWSGKLFRLQFDLFREGCSPREVFTLSKNAACNKFDRDSKPDSELWKTVQKGYQKFIATVEGPTIVAPAPRETWAVPDFLSETERLNLPSSFIDRYTSWVAERTDSAQQYTRTLACMLLSWAFGDRGYIRDKWGRVNLNLWATLVGPTSSTRKTTNRDLALGILHAFELNALGGDTIDIGSDTTKEALGKALGPRDGRVSLLQVDEVSGMFAEFRGKHYQAGTMEYLTKLYDGNVPVVLRATKDAGQPVRAKTVFSFLGSGVPELVTEVLTRKDLESGFLARMLWAVADAPPRKPGSDDWNDDEGVDTVDSGMGKWAMDLKVRAYKFDPKKPTVVRIGKRAQSRYNQWAEMVRQHAEGHSDPIVNAIVTRFQHSVRKLSALLAMYDGVSVIELHHLLPALAQAQLWYADMLRMISEVSASSFEKLQSDMERFIATGAAGLQDEAAVRRKFGHLRPQEFSDVLTTLKSQGRVRVMGDKLQLLV